MIAIQPVLRGSGPTEIAPHGRGNIYAPEVLIEGGQYRMWYGGFGRDGHDRIHYAVSRDGVRWTRKGVVLDAVHANHVNDPSVVRVGRALFMYYTRAVEGVLDRIDVALSANGTHWDTQGPALEPGPAGAWDSLLVGRPAVIKEGNRFQMWYDGRTSLDAPRSIGYATSVDGIHWTKYMHNPIYGDNAGAVDVKRIRGILVMVYESTSGTMMATSVNGVSWTPRGLWIPRSGKKRDQAGHVTPAICAGPLGRFDSVYVGAAADASWTNNSIARVQPTREMIAAIVA